MRARFVVSLGLMSAACFSDPPADHDAGSATTDATSTSAPDTTTAVVDASTTSPDSTGDSTTAPSGAMRQTITLDTSDVSERLTDIPVLIRFDPSVVDYDAMLGDGADVRFVSDGGTVLAHEIEAWTPGGETIVWVRLSEVAAGASTTVIELRYGDPTAPLPPGPTEVWSSYEAVWHLPDTTDATGNGHDLVGDPLPVVDGPFGPAVEVPMGSTGLEAPDDDGRLSLGGAGTFEAWVATLVNTQVGGGTHRIAVDKWPNYRLISVSGSGTPSPQVLCQVDGVTQFASVTTPLDIGTWVRLAGTLRVPQASDEFCVHASGQPKGCRNVPGAPDPTSTALRIGTMNLQAELDEVRISAVARSDGWLRLQERAVEPDFAVFGPAEPG